MMKSIIFIIFIINIIALTIAQTPQPKNGPPRCITTSNIYVNSSFDFPSDGEVNWWFINQLINQDAIYTDSNLKESEKVLQVEGFQIRDFRKESPLFKTYIQSFENSEYHSISYNDAPDKKGKFSNHISFLKNKKEIGPGSGHAKGFFIWNKFGGLHVIHSYPESPTKLKDRFVPEEGGDSYSQHAMCIELSKSELKIIPKYLIYANADIQTINDQRVNCWKGKVAACYVSLSLMQGDITINNIVHEVNKIDNWDFNSKFINNTLVELDEITTFEDMEDFFGRTILMNDNWANEIGKWQQIAYKIAGSYITSRDEITLDGNGNNVHYYMAMNHNGINGKYFIQTSNGYLRTNYQYYDKDLVKILNQTKHEIIWKYIKNYGDYYDIHNWISHTMTSGHGGQNSMFINEPGMDLVYKFQSETYQEYNNGKRSTLKEIATSEDHSKLLYGYNTNNFNRNNVFCVGDLNWQGIQALRGGGAYCRTDLGYLTDFYVRRVSWFQSYDDEYITDSRAILNSLFTVRSTFNLDWIGNKLIMYYKVYGTLNEITPNIYEGASFELADDFKSMLKLLVTKPDNYSTVGEITVYTEPFSVRVNPSIPEKVFICSEGSETCNLESSIKIEILKDVELPVKYEIPNLSGRSFSRGDDKFAVPIKVEEPTNLNWLQKDRLKDLYDCGKIAEGYVDDVGQEISLVRTIQHKVSFKSNFTFPLISISINDICDGEIGIGSILFNEECQDLLYICLYRNDALLVSKGLLTRPEEDVISLLTQEFDVGNIKWCLESTLENNSGDSSGQTSVVDAQNGIKRARTLPYSNQITIVPI